MILEVRMLMRPLALEHGPKCRPYQRDPNDDRKAQNEEHHANERKILRKRASLGLQGSYYSMNDDLRGAGVGVQHTVSACGTKRACVCARKRAGGHPIRARTPHRCTPFPHSSRSLRGSSGRKSPMKLQKIEIALCAWQVRSESPCACRP